MKVLNFQKNLISRFFSIFLLSALLGAYMYTINIDNHIERVSAEGACPPEMSDEECLRYLQDLASQIQDDKDELNSKISDEEFAQLDLYQKIRYYNSQIAATEASISQLELEIEKNNLEIKILGKDIETAENDINTASQEITKLQNALKKRVAISYKYSSVSPVEMVFNTEEFESLMRRLAYLKETRERDKNMLEGMSEKKAELSQKKSELADKKLEVQQKRDEVEQNKSALFAEQSKLGSQRGEQQALLNESKRREDEYQRNLASLKRTEEGITQQITQLIMELYQSGQLPANTPVNAGDIIGYQGHTGLAYGGHLHFEYRVNGAVKNPFTTGCLTGGYGQYIGAGVCAKPLNPGYVTQFPHSSNSAVDMIADLSDNRMYWSDGVSCYGMSVPPGWYRMNGEGAAVRTIKSGMVSRVFTDACGGRAVIVDHGNGETSLYLHLR